MDKHTVPAVRQAVCDTARAMADSGLTAGTWGNVSGRVDDTFMVITPSGMDYHRLTPEQMVLVNMRTGEYEGGLKPSVEVPLHARLLLTRPEVGGIIHTHSPKALAVAAAHRGIPAVCDDQVQILGGSIRCAPYTMPGTREMADTVAQALEGRMGALIANHGAVAMGRTLSEALTAAVVLEKTAQVWIDAQALGGAVEISDEDCAFFHDFFLHKYGQK